MPSLLSVATLVYVLLVAATLSTANGVSPGAGSNCQNVYNNFYAGVTILYVWQFQLSLLLISFLKKASKIYLLFSVYKNCADSTKLADESAVFTPSTPTTLVPLMCIVTKPQPVGGGQ